ncbi:hypothetical protein NKG05_17880 [Oerskovia sp. M15]
MAAVERAVTVPTSSLTPPLPDDGGSPFAELLARERVRYNAVLARAVALGADREDLAAAVRGLRPLADALAPRWASGLRAGRGRTRRDSDAERGGGSVAPGLRRTMGGSRPRSPRPALAALRPAVTVAGLADAARPVVTRGDATAWGRRVSAAAEVAGDGTLDAAGIRSALLVAGWRSGLVRYRQAALAAAAALPVAVARAVLELGPDADVAAVLERHAADPWWWPGTPPAVTRFGGFRGFGARGSRCRTSSGRCPAHPASSGPSARPGRTSRTGRSCATRTGGRRCARSRAPRVKAPDPRRRPRPHAACRGPLARRRHGPGQDDDPVGSPDPGQPGALVLARPGADRAMTGPTTAGTPTSPGLRDRWLAAWPDALAAWGSTPGCTRPCCTTATTARRGVLIRMVLDRGRRGAHRPRRRDREQPREPRRGDPRARGRAPRAGPGDLTTSARIVSRVRDGLVDLDQHAGTMANLWCDLLVNDRLQRRAASTWQRSTRSSAPGGHRSPRWSCGPTRSSGASRAGRSPTRITRCPSARRACAPASCGPMPTTPSEALVGSRRSYDLSSSATGPRTGTARRTGPAWSCARSRSPSVPCPPVSRPTPPSGDPCCTRARSPRDGSDAVGPRGPRPRRPGRARPGRRGAADALGQAISPRATTPSCDSSGSPRRARSPRPAGTGRTPCGISSRSPCVRTPRRRGAARRARAVGRRRGPRGRRLDRDGAALARDRARRHDRAPRARAAGGRDPVPRPYDLDLYLDSSGSMPNPQQSLAPIALAGAVLALSALRAGARVQATTWSGPGQIAGTDGFTRDADAILAAIVAHFGGGTAFPVPLLERTHLGTPSPVPRPCAPGPRTSRSSRTTGSARCSSTTSGLARRPVRPARRRRRHRRGPRGPGGRRGGSLVLQGPRTSPGTSPRTPRLPDVRRAHDR